MGTGSHIMKQEVLRNEDAYSCPLSKATQEVARKELNETAKLRKKALAEVRHWVRTQPHIKKARLDSSFILRFLRMQKFEIKESCEILDKYLTMRCQYPTWFQNLHCQTLCPGVTSLCCQRGTSMAGGSFSRELQP